MRHGLGADLLHLRGIDTDRLGSLCGTVPRQGTALQACIAKMEWMVFLDRRRGLTIQEQLLAARTNFAHTQLPATAITAGQLPESLHTWLAQVGFPSHALIVRPNQPGDMANSAELRQGVRGVAALGEAIAAAATASDDGLALLETDMRAHCNPTRMASIRRLSFRLMRRIARPCPACGSPGWGVIQSIAGLPCGWCGLPTALTRWLEEGCGACGHSARQPRPDGLLQADPGHCPHCNP